MNQMNTSAHSAPSNYSPVDAVNRHDYGVQKNRKQASTGGGRAWSEEEVRITLRIIDRALLIFQYRKSIFYKLASRKCPTSTLPTT